MKQKNYNTRKSKEKKKRKDMCTCCGIRPKHDGFRYLCKYCWLTANGDASEHGVFIGRESTSFV